MGDNDFVFLGNFNDNDHEADIVESLLRQMYIPVMRKYPDTGAYLDVYLGTSPFGVSLYVPKSKLSMARDVITNKSVEGEYEEIMWSDDEKDEEEIELLEDNSDFSILAVFRFIARLSIGGFFFYYLIKLILQLFYYVLYYFSNL